MGLRRRVSVAMGVTQGIIGGLATAFAYILYYDFFGVQAILNVPQKDVILYMLILIVFGLLQIISALFLIREQ